VRSKIRFDKTVNSMRTSPMVRLRVSPYRISVATTLRTPTLASRREFFRLPYPVMSGAILAVGGTNYIVGEVSEGGLRLVASSNEFPVEQRIEGTLVLTAGVRCTVTGTVLRIDDKHVVLKLTRGPTSYDVIREQRHVAKQFPDWKPGA
jgi:PilZ domain